MNFNNKIVKFLLKLAVSAGLIAWLFFKINWAEVFKYIQMLTMEQIILYMTLLLLGMSISAYKWQILAKFKGFEFTLKYYFQLYLTGAFLNNFFPSFIGGDTYRSYQIGRSVKKYSAAGATVVMDRITGLFGAMVLSLFFSVLNWRIILANKSLLFFNVIIILIFLLIFSMEFIGKFEVWKKIAKILPAKFLEILKDFGEYKGSLALNKALLLSMLYGFVGIAVLNYVLFWALGIKIEVLNYLSVIFLISFVSAIPISINNIGVKEWAYVTFFGFFGVASSGVVAVALISRILQMIVSFAALPIYLKDKHK